MIGIGLILYIAASVYMMTQKRFRFRHLIGLAIGITLGAFAPVVMPVMLGLLAIQPRNERAKKRAEERRQDKAERKSMRKAVRECDKSSKNAEEFNARLKARRLALVVTPVLAGAGGYMVGVRKENDHRVFPMKDLFGIRSNVTDLLHPERNPFNNKEKFTDAFYESQTRSAGEAKTEDKQEKPKGLAMELPEKEAEVAEKKSMSVDVLRNPSNGKTVYILPERMRRSKQLDDLKKQLKQVTPDSYFCFDTEREAVCRNCGVTDNGGTCPKNSLGYLKEKAVIDENQVDVSWSPNRLVQETSVMMGQTVKETDQYISGMIGSEKDMQFRNAVTMKQTSQREVSLEVNGKPVVEGRINDDGSITAGFTSSDVERLGLEQKGIDIGRTFENGKTYSAEEFSFKCKQITGCKENLDVAKSNYNFIKARQQMKEGMKEAKEEIKVSDALKAADESTPKPSTYVKGATYAVKHPVETAKVVDATIKQDEQKVMKVMKEHTQKTKKSMHR